MTHIVCFMDSRTFRNFFSKSILQAISIFLNTYIPINMTFHLIFAPQPTTILFPIYSCQLEQSNFLSIIQTNYEHSRPTYLPTDLLTSIDWRWLGHLYKCLYLSGCVTVRMVVFGGSVHTNNYQANSLSTSIWATFFNKHLHVTTSDLKTGLSVKL